MMNLEIRDLPFERKLFGCARAVSEGQKPGEVMFAAMDEMWAIVRQHSLSTDGINHIVYTGSRQVFAGVEIQSPISADWGLAEMNLKIPRYAYYRHVGAYDLLGEAYRTIQRDLDARGLKTTELSLEIYGHWNENPAKLVTEIIHALE
jgi:effector-binding domain-containing protein